jgi:hypothetical protein
MRLYLLFEEEKGMHGHFGGRMKRFLLFVILHSLFVILVCSSTEAQWEGTQVQRLTYNDVPDIGQERKLYIDDNDNLYLFYLEGIRDTATGFVYHYKLLFMRKDKEGWWSQPEEIGNPARIGWADMEVGYDTKHGIIHIVYARFLSLAYDTMYYTNSEMPNWQLVKIDSLSNDRNAEYHSLSMGFDSLGNVHLVWNVDFDSIGYEWYRVMYANNSTGEWVKQQVSPPIFLGGMGSGPAQFSVQKNGTAHIVYQGEASCDLDCQAFYVTNDSINSTNWITDTVPRPSRPLLYYGAGLIKVDVNDRIHLLTSGCIREDCGPWPGLVREFYYYKQPDDSVWTGPELILDSLMYTRAIFLDRESVPYLAEWDPFTYCWFFTDRKQGFWREPYRILDTTSMCNALSSTYATDFSFILDSGGRGHAVFIGCLRQFMAQDDSLEVFYFGAPLSSVEDTVKAHRKLSFELYQNYPNPFNQNTVIHYSLDATHPIPTSLKIYNILGKEVRALVNTRQSPGNYTVIWDGKDNFGKEVASGIYFYLLQAGERKEGRKMLLIK